MQFVCQIKPDAGHRLGNCALRALNFLPRNRLVALFLKTMCAFAFWCPENLYDVALVVF